MTDTRKDWVEEMSSLRSERAGRGSLNDARSAGEAVAFLSGGYPDPQSLPMDDIAESTRVALESEGQWALQYGSSAGDPRLVSELLRKLERDQGITASPENILITAGGSQAVALITDMLVDPGDVVISEVPTWTGAVTRFKAAGADVREVDVDSDGLDVQALEQQLQSLKAEGRSAKLLYVIPNFQNPTGITTTLERRQRIVELAHEYNLPVMEDDAYYDLRYAGEFLPPLYTLDSSGHVMYVGTFSKIMAAGMRLGWVVANPDVIAHLIALKAEGGTSPFTSHVAMQFAASGTLVEHIHELRGVYQHRCEVMIDTLKEMMPEGTGWTVPEGGFFIWVTLPEGVSARRLQSAAADRGVPFRSGPDFYFHGRGDNQLRLSYSFPDESQIRAGIQVLGELTREQMRQ